MCLCNMIMQILMAKHALNLTLDIEILDNLMVDEVDRANISRSYIMLTDSPLKMVLGDIPHVILPCEKNSFTFNKG